MKNIFSEEITGNGEKFEENKMRADDVQGWLRTIEFT